VSVQNAKEVNYADHTGVILDHTGVMMDYVHVPRVDNVISCIYST
jgi:hypothetical protein